MHLERKLPAQAGVEGLKFAGQRDVLRDVFMMGSEPVFRHNFKFFYKVNYMKQVQRGFTLIELVMVIVILGVLSAVALPTFVNLKGEAQTGAAQGVAGALASASAINFAANKINASTYPAVTTCTATAALLQGGLPTGFTIGGTAPTSCNVKNDGGGVSADWVVTQ